MSGIMPRRRDHGNAMLDRLCRRTHWRTPTLRPSPHSGAGCLREVPHHSEAVSPLASQP